MGERKRDVEGKCASGGKKKSGIYDFSGAPSEKREENDIQPGDCGGAVRWQCKGTAIFQTVSPAARAPSRCPMVIRYFFPNVHANTPFTYPLPIATKFTLSLGMKIRVVAATRPFGVTFMRNWVIRWKQLSVLKRKRRCRRRSFRWNVVGLCPGIDFPEKMIVGQNNYVHN